MHWLYPQHLEVFLVVIEMNAPRIHRWVQTTHLLKSLWHGFGSTEEHANAAAGGGIRKGESVTWARPAGSQDRPSQLGSRHASEAICLFSYLSTSFVRVLPVCSTLLQPSSQAFRSPVIPRLTGARNSEAEAGQVLDNSTGDLWYSRVLVRWSWSTSSWICG